MARLLTILFVGLICEAIGVVLLSRGLKEISGWFFSAEDIRAPEALAAKLRTHADPVSQSVWQKFSPEEQAALSDPKTERSGQRAVLAKALNSVLRRPSEFDPNHLSQVPLSDRVRQLAAEPVQASDLIERNRLVLEDSFPQELRKRSGEAKSIGQVAQLVRRGVTNAHILLGVFFEALFFVGLLMLMSKADVSFVWPLTSLSFVVTTIAAKIYLHETVTPLRWSGVCLIMMGAALISWTEKQKSESAPRPAVLQSSGRNALPLQ